MSRRSATVFATHGGRLIHAPGIGTIEVRTNEDGRVEAFVNRALSPEEKVKLDEWLSVEWRKRTS